MKNSSLLDKYLSILNLDIDKTEQVLHEDIHLVDPPHK